MCFAAGILLAGTAATQAPAVALAAPGTPGVTQPANVLFSEDFENVTAATPILLTAYTGASGMTYTADPGWLTACNGNVLSFNTPTTSWGTCTAAINAHVVGQLAWALGRNAGAANPAANNAVTAYTESPAPGANRVQIQTKNNIPLPSSAGRFLTLTVDTAALNCSSSAPQYQFSVLDQNATVTPVGGIVNACTSATTVVVPARGSSASVTARVGTYTPTGSFLFTGSSVGVRMTNANGAAGGNDAAFDNIRLVDVTPQLDKSFAPASAPVGSTSRLTFTVTNTSELAAKNGWSFTDTLPSGLTLAATPAASTTCASTTITAQPGSTTIGATGSLNASETSCTVSIDVTSSTVATYTNGPSNVAVVGLNAPGNATVSFTGPSLELVKHAGTPTDTNGNGRVDVGDTIPYTFTVTNTGSLELTAVAVSDPKAGTVSCPASTLAPAASQLCTATQPYAITAADMSAGVVENTATAAGTPSVGTRITSSPSSTQTPTAAPAAELIVVKSVPRRANPNDQFTVAAHDSANAQVTAASTVGTTTTAESARVVVTLGGTYTITDELNPGSPSPAGRYRASLVCTDLSTGTAIPIAGPGPEWTFSPTENVPYRCVVTNTARTLLTLVKEVTFGAVPATAWTLSAQADVPALPGPNGATGAAAATADVSPGVAYTLSEDGGPDTYAARSAWECVDDDAAAVPSDGAEVAVPDGSDVTCTITNTTAQLVLLKHVEDPALDPAAWTLSATPSSGFALTEQSGPGGEEPSAANTFEVRPGHPYAIAENPAAAAGTIAFRQVRIQQLVAGQWIDIDPQDGSPEITVAAGETGTYRFVNDSIPTITLPFTGGVGTDLILTIGGALLALAAAAELWRRHHRPERARCFATTRRPQMSTHLRTHNQMGKQS